MIKHFIYILNSDNNNVMNFTTNEYYIIIVIGTNTVILIS